MAPDDVATALADRSLRDLAVRAFDDEQMAHAMYAAKGGSLVQKLNWLDAEDSSWKLVKPLLTDPALPAGEKTAVYSRNYLRTFFTKVCDDDEMEEAVGLLGGSLEAQLNWMFVEGTSEAAVKRRLRAHPPAERIRLYRLDYIRDFFVGLVGDDGMAAMVDVIGGTLNDRLNWMAVEDTNYRAVADRIRKASDTDYKTVDAATRARLKDDLSAKEFAKVEAMLDRGILDTEEVDKARDESHWEKKDYTDPTSKWYMETFEVESKYQIERSRSELRDPGADPLHGHHPVARAHDDLAERDQPVLERDVPSRERRRQEAADRLRAAVRRRVAAPHDRAAPAGHGRLRQGHDRARGRGELVRRSGGERDRHDGRADGGARVRPPRRARRRVSADQEGLRADRRPGAGGGRAGRRLHVADADGEHVRRRRAEAHGHVRRLGERAPAPGREGLRREGRSVSGRLLTALAGGGGIPPATSELLRVYDDGAARAVVGNAWPLGAPQDEAGSYEQQLAPEELAALRDLVGAARPAPPDRAPTPDSGRRELVLPGGRVAWALSAPAPEPLAPLVERLGALLAATRRHPLGALALGLDAAELTLHNPGSEPVALHGPGTWRLRAGDGARPSLADVLAGEELAVELPERLGPGERRTVATSLAAGGSAHVVALLDADVPYEGEPLRLSCVLFAGAG